MKKQITGGVALSFVSQLIAVAVGLVYTPIMIRILGQSEFGLYQLVQSVVNYLTLMNMGFSGAYIRFFSLAKAKQDEQEIANLNGLFMKIFLLISILCVAAGVALYFNIGILGDQLTAADYVIARKLLAILVINLAISFPSSMFTVYMSANERFVFQQLVNIGVNILIPAFTLPLLWLGYGSVGVVLVTLVLTILRLAVNAWYCLRKLKMKIHIRYFSRKFFMGLLGFTFFIFLSDVVDQLNTNVDKFLLGRILGTVSVAVYSVGFNLRYYYTIISWIIPEMFIPEANRIAIGEKDDNKLTEIFTRVGRYNNYILMLILTGFVLVGKPFIQLWVGDGYEEAYYVAFILMLSAYIPSVQTLGVNIQNAKDMHRMRSIIYFIIASINVVVSIFLIRKWGVTGACVGTLVAVLLGSGLFMNIYYHRKIKLNVIYFWREILRWTIPAGLLCTGTWFLMKNIAIGSWGSLFLFAMCYGIIYIALLWLIGFRKEEKAFIRETVSRMLPGHRKA